MDQPLLAAVIVTTLSDKDELVEDRLLAQGRRHQDRVQNRDDRSGHGPDDVQYVVPIGSAEDAVLVLHDDDIEAVERVAVDSAPSWCPRTHWWRTSGDRGALATSTMSTTPTTSAGERRLCTSAEVNVASPHWVGG